MARRPRLAEGIRFEPKEDGFVVRREAQNRVHFLNGTASLVLALSDGTNAVADIAATLQEHYGLREPPLDDVERVLGQLVEEGLVVDGAAAPADEGRDLGPVPPPSDRASAPSARVLILTPVKDAAPYLPGYFANLASLTYPHELLSLGMLEGDSRDGTFAALEGPIADLAGRFRRARHWQRDFGYRIPADLPRWTYSLQMMRRSVLARSRNHLLSRALDDEDWVLWIDVDVIEYPPDIVERLLAVGRSIVHPNCVCDWGGPSFDRNARRGREQLLLSDLRQEGDMVELDTVGGTMLLIRADLHRDGLVFPPFPYGRPNERARSSLPAIETEGLACMAWDMGHRCWGLPNLEVRHAPE